uniref:Oxysterol-binding protein n=1 Tax=Spermophilus dauricus TaxID=99837 RepID=A0A8C9Q0E2_SPEDA
MDFQERDTPSLPERQEGHLLKKRKWPLKGWHKRYFVLEDGILHYATTRQDITKGKFHGSIDVRLSVMSINKKAQRIDLDTEDNIYHLKIKSQDLFQSWVAQLRAHRQAQRLDLPSTTHRKAPGTQLLTAGSTSALPGVGPREKVSSWLRDSDGLDRCSHALSECQGKLQELHRLLQSLESLHRIPSAPVIPTHQASVTTERPKKGKRTSRMWCTQSFAKDDTIGRVRWREDPSSQFLVHTSLSSVLAALTTERDRLRDLHQGSELSRMGVSEAPAGQRRLHSLSISSDTTADSFSSLNPEEQEALYMKGRELTPQLSQSSILSLADSHTEFFDACEVLLSASSSENEVREEEKSCTSEITTSLSEEVLDLRGAERYQRGARRACGCGVWVGRGIAFALSGSGIVPLGGLKPCSLPEPLGAFCEELEYSSLLDQASHMADPCERMVYIAAFAVSAYSSTYHRAGCKPFNPVLGETYECERPDRGFRFISEQVSHHPPISACHAESENFVFWQDMKWKNKFWGKSLEIVPVGTVNVSLPRFGDHFEWNKVTSCIHNILSGQRWIEHYGEVLIRNTQDSSCHCKITFCKAKYWSSNVHEVQGAVLSRSGRVLHRLFGKWHEGLYRGPPPGGQCIWKPNSMPPDHERNFGFTQFALELNELTAELKRTLPSTDTRLRPDQRYLEEGNIQAAEAQKRRIEQLQRDRRRVMEENNIVHQARFFRRQTDSSGKEWWVTNNTYWRLRAEPGYGDLDGAGLW